MITKKGEIYYYITKKIIIELEAIWNFEGYTTVPFKIIDYVRGTPEDAGTGKLGILDVGKKITSNQLNYVSSEGADKLIFKKGTESIKGVFENEIL